ncbi:unnamed protein product [Gordionus sp. m RMFG-2023]
MSNDLVPERDTSKIPDNSKEAYPLLQSAKTPYNAGQSYREGEYDPNNKKWSLSARHTLALIGFLGFVTVYALRANLSVAIVAMSNSTHAKDSHKISKCKVKETAHVTQKLGEFNWDSLIQGYILAGFFYGYIFTQIPGGWLASYSAKYTLGLGVFWTAFLTLFTAMAARMSPYGLLVLRVLEGLGEGVTFPAMHALWAKWAPPQERSKLVAFTYAGAPMGNVIAYPLSGWLCQHGFAGGWPSVFYVMGLLGCIWYIFWQFFVYETPAKHPRISKAELAYLQENISYQDEKLPIPWLKIFGSIRFWAIAAAHFSYNWGFYTMITILPKFFRDVLNLNVESNGLYSALPFLAQWAMIGLSGAAADFLTKKGMSITLVRRIFNTCGLVIPACFLIGVGYVECNVPLAISLLTIGVGFTGMAHVGFFVSHLDIAPPFAGMLMSLTNTIATIPGAVAPSVAAAITRVHSDAEHWRIVFFIAAMVYIAGAVFYFFFISGEEQSWARAPKDRNVSPNTKPGALTKKGNPEITVGPGAKGYAPVSTTSSPSDNDTELRNL